MKVRCWLEVMAAYEQPVFRLPDVRRDWRVATVQIERRTLIEREVTGGNGRTYVEGTAGDVVELVEMPRMRMWADDPTLQRTSDAARPAIEYVLDLSLK